MQFSETERYVVENKKEVINILKNFCLTDVILFWSNDAELLKRQNEKWNDILLWLKNKYSLDFVKTFDIFPPQHNERTASDFAHILENLPLSELCSCYCCALRLKSPLLAFAAVKGKIDFAEAFEISLLEEKYQNQRWGEDSEEADKRKHIYEDIMEIKEYIGK